MLFRHPPGAGMSVLVTRSPSATFDGLANIDATLGNDYWLGFVIFGLSPYKKRLAWLGAQRLVLTPGLVLGCNQGFVADGHHGLNHIAARLGADYQLFDGLSLEAHATYSWALGREVLRPGDADLRDFGHVGAAVRWEF